MTKSGSGEYYETKSGRIIEKRLFALIQERNGVMPMKAVQKPPAQYPREYSPGLKGVDHILEIYFGIVKDPCLPDAVKAVIEVQYLTGCRISEVLNIQSRDVTKYGTIKLKGLKGSDNRFVTPVLFKDYWLQTKESGYTPGYLFSRFYFHRLYKRKGLYSWMEGTRNNAVTHCFRKLHAKGFYDLDKSIEDVRQSLGQKSTKSAEHYVQEKRKSINTRKRNT